MDTPKTLGEALSRIRDLREKLSLFRVESQHVDMLERRTQMFGDALKEEQNLLSLQAALCLPNDTPLGPKAQTAFQHILERFSCGSNICPRPTN